MKHSLPILFSLVFLAACGGGGGSSDEQSSPNVAPTIQVDGAAPGDSTCREERGRRLYGGRGRHSSDDTGTPSVSLGGADAGLFTWSSADGQLSFIEAPDFESPGSAAGTNIYDVSVTASDAIYDTRVIFEVTVVDLYEGSGRVIDGPVSGAAVFVDLNCNDIGDADEPTGTTDSDGFFAIASESSAAEGCSPKIIASGGTDTATGNAFEGVLKADVPADQTKTSAVTPLTTVIASVESAEDKQKVLTALGLGDKTPEEIATTDPWAGSEAGDESAQAIQRVNTQVATVLKTAAKVSEGGTSDATAVSNSVAQSIASAATAAADTGASVDLSEPDTIGDVLEDAAEDAGVEVDEAVVNAVAKAVSVVNTAAADQTVNPTSTVAIEIAQAAEETIEDDVADVVTGETSVEEFEESTSAEAILGDVDTGDAPDLDGDGLADAVDDDDDGDGVSDSVDAFPRDSTESVDTDSDGVGNNADDDDDG